MLPKAPCKDAGAGTRRTNDEDWSGGCREELRHSDRSQANDAACIPIAAGDGRVKSELIATVG
jgi:hypothetical protein